MMLQIGDNVEVIDEDEIDLDIISVGCNVTVLDKLDNEEVDFMIVGATETDSREGKISNESPVGSALLGKREGDIVTVETPMGEMEYEVLAIHRGNRGE